MSKQLDRYRTLAGILRDAGRQRANTLEVTGIQYLVDPHAPLMSFRERKMNLDYVKAELQWYLEGDQHDGRIGDHASIWARIFQVDGMARSNYGHWLFAKRGLKKAVDMLIRDPYSRRAVVYIGSNRDVDDDLADQPCTNSLQFLATQSPAQGRTANPVTDWKLDLIVSMRSQDFIYGTANDAPFFAMVLLIAAGRLDMQPGEVVMQVGSLHVYERHFDMASAIAVGATPEPALWPSWLIPAEANELMMGNWKDTAWGQWLSTAPLGLRGSA